jgi:Cdc6-like AAA superfamily ATPase
VSDYPDRNPFPTGTMTIEARMTYSLAGAPTALRSSMLRLVTLARRYVEDDPAHRAGRVVALRGQYGTGKTHTLLYTLADLTGPGGRRPGAPLVLYVRADGPDSKSLYQKLMSQLALDTLRDLVEHAFTSYAADAFSATRAAEPLPEDESIELDKPLPDVADQLRGDPALMRRALETKSLSWTAVVAQQERDMERIQGRLGGFDRAVRGLLETKLEDLAHRWFVGGTLDARELAALGVSANIERPDETRLGIHVLAALARAARRPLVLALDQAEALIGTPGGALDRHSVGWLRALVEAFAEERGFLAVAMSERAWSELPEDLQSRFEPSVIVVRGLELEESKAMLGAYLEPFAPDPPIYPFQQDAVRRLLTVSGGNARRFLQTAREAFTLAKPDRAWIDAALVERAVAENPERLPSEDDVRGTIERVLARKGLPFEAEHLMEKGQRVDYAVLRGQRPVLYIELSGAVFAQDEARVAIVNLEKIRAARQRNVPILLIVVGYSSPEVTELLERAATTLVVADDPAFEPQIESAIGASSAPDQAEGLGAFSEELERFRESLGQIADRREVDEQLVSRRLRETEADASATQRSDQLRTYRQAWNAERQRLEREIAESRAARRLADVTELIESHRTHVRERQRRVHVGAAAVGLVIVIAAIIGVTSAVAPLVLAILLAGLVLVAAADLILTLRLGGHLEAAGRVGSFDQLDQFARELPAARVYSSDPLLRYAAVLESPGRDLLPVALDEPQPLVRRRCVVRLVAEGRTMDVLRSELDPQSRGIAVERATRESSAIAEDFSLSDRLGILARISGTDWESAVFGSFSPELAWAFGDGGDEALATAVAGISDRELNRLSNALSPFSDDGLGAWYWLESLERIDDVYLFLRRAALLAAGGLAAPQAR